VAKTTRALAFVLVCALPWLAAPAHGGAGDAVCGDSAVEGTEQCDDGNTEDWDGCSASCQIRLCMDPPPPDCVMAFHGTLSVSQRGKDDKRTAKFKLELSGFSEDAALLDFGDPVFGLTRYDLCVYGELPYPYGQVIVPRGFDTCGKKEKACWKKKGEDTYVYSDEDLLASGVRKILFQAGPRGEGRISVTAARTKKSPYLGLMNSALEGDASAEIRIMSSDGRCFGGSFTDLLVNETERFKARVE
jgi:cysteine-rich repeat protein